MKVYLDKSKTKLLAEISEEVRFSTVLKVKDKYYVISCYGPDFAIAESIPNFTEKEEELTERQEYTCYNEDKLICPVCKEIIDDPPYNSITTYCPNCGAELKVEVEYTVSYYPKVKSLPRIVEVK